ncbi:MAG: hypothetical protein ACRC4N_03810, partial [Gammaproteobacteria bacterium]
CHKILHILMFITSFGEQNITYKCCSNFLIHLCLKTLLDDKYTSLIEKESINVLDINGITKQLNNFGITNLEELDSLITEYTEKYNFDAYDTPLSFFTILMFLIDIEKYFKSVYVVLNHSMEYAS